MPFRLTKIKQANIPEALRLTFENMGVEVVSQIMARHLEIQGNRYKWPMTFELPGQTIVEERLDREHAISWLTEQRSREERRREITERVEFWILILVAVEALPILLGAAAKCWELRTRVELIH